MKSMTKNSIFTIALTLVMAIGGFQLASAALPRQTTPPTPGPHNTNRGDSYPVQVDVKLGGQPVAGITVTAKAKNSVTAVTGENGVAVFQLVSGRYTVTASNDSGTATAKAKVVASTKPLQVHLALAPKAP